MTREFGDVPTDESVPSVFGIDMHPNSARLWTVDESGDSWGHDGPFTGQVNGNPTSTSVPYDTDVDEDSICTNMVLHNTTKGKKVKITGVNVGANTIAVEANSPDDADTWDDNDVITTASQINTGRTNGFVDIEVTDFLNSATAEGIFFQDTLGSNNANDTLTLIVHPYAAYSQAKETHNLKAAGLPAFSFGAGNGMVNIVWENGRAYFTLGVFWEADQLSGLLTFLAEWG